MKNASLFLVFLTANLQLISLAQTPQQADPDRAKMALIIQRVRTGDKRALLEASNIRPEVSIPVLSQTAKYKSTDPEKAELAREALSRVKGVEDYLKHKIDGLGGVKMHDAIDERNRQIEILAMVRTNRAIRTIANYLFDDNDPGYSEGDSGMPSNKSAAAMALDQMNFPGAPSTVYDIEDQHIAAWRAWWLNNKERFGDSVPYAGLK